MANIRIALCGNPNVGKSSIYNKLTRSSVRVGNYHGVTVSATEKRIRYKNDDLIVVDLPGAYSFTPFSEEEACFSENLENTKPDIVAVVCDVGNLNRNIYLYEEVRERGYKTIVVINMIDELQARGGKIDLELLKKRLDCEVVAVSAKKGEVTPVLDAAIVELNKLPRPKRLLNNRECDTLTDRYRQAETRRAQVERDVDGVVTFAKPPKINFDKLALDKFFALPFFALVMATIFFITFGAVGQFLSNGLEFGFNALEGAVGSLTTLPDWVVALLRDGVIGSVSAVAVFLPQVVLLYFFIGLLEDSGYIGRTAFLTDGFFAKFGLSGRAAFTLIMGFGCSATAILSARTAGGKNAKIKTVLLTPFMSCGGKLPVYTAVASGFLGLKPLIIFALYMLGIVVMLFTAWLLSRVKSLKGNVPLVLELPPYRLPSASRVAAIALRGAGSFITRVGSAVLGVGVIAWVLTNFSLSGGFGSENTLIKSLGELLSPLFAPLGFNSGNAVIALLSGLVAKEAIIGTAGSLGGINAILGNSAAARISFLVFTLLYVPCSATIITIYREIGARFAVFSCLYHLTVAYVCSFFFFNLVSVFSSNATVSNYISVLSFLIILVAATVVLTLLRVRRKAKLFKSSTKPSHAKSVAERK